MRPNNYKRIRFLGSLELFGNFEHVRKWSGLFRQSRHVQLFNKSHALELNLTKVERYFLINADSQSS